MFAAEIVGASLKPWQHWQHAIQVERGNATTDQGYAVAAGVDLASLTADLEGQSGAAGEVDDLMSEGALELSCASQTQKPVGLDLIEP